MYSHPIVITYISSLLTYDEYTITKILKCDNSCEFEILQTIHGIQHQKINPM
jgi:hypothetical protein